MTPRLGLEVCTIAPSRHWNTCAPFRGWGNPRVFARGEAYALIGAAPGALIGFFVCARIFE